MSKLCTLRDWALDRTIRRVQIDMEPWVEEQANTVAAAIRKNISQQGPPASLPGNFPHKRTGRLQESIQVQRGGQRGEMIVYSDAPYALDLELGNRKIGSERSYFRRTLLSLRRLFTRVQIHR